MSGEKEITRTRARDADDLNSLLLTINGGSSSLKFAVFRAATTPTRVVTGKIERIGLSDSMLSVTDSATGATKRHAVEAPHHRACVSTVCTALAEHVSLDAIVGIGHRVVHGGARYFAPERITPDVLAELERLSPLDPEHLPAEIALIGAFHARDARVAQVACFDTAFHHRLPRVATLLPIPRRYESEGVRRYGFHGLSYAFVMKELARRFGSSVARSRVIVAHLGNGASLAAVSDGTPVDTSMAFTPAAGVAMSTRSGDLDPGLAAYFARAHGMTAHAFDRMVNHESGLLGVSETSSDVRDLLAREATDARAADALALFCYQVRKWIGAFAAALGGLDTLVFTAGIGENAPAIRARIVDGLDFLGIALDAARNGINESLISKDGAPVAVYVIPTDEEAEIAAAVCSTVGATNSSA
jgi:acetate kinase